MSDKCAEHEKAKEIAFANWSCVEIPQSYTLIKDIAEALAEAHEAGRREAIAEVLPVLEFYANKDNWGTYSEDEDSGTNALLIAADKGHYSDVWVGHRARALLAKLNAEGAK